MDKPFAFAVDKSEFIFSIRPRLRDAVQDASDRFGGMVSCMIDITAWWADGREPTPVSFKRLTVGTGKDQRWLTVEEADQLEYELFPG